MATAKIARSPTSAAAGRKPPIPPRPALPSRKVLENRIEDTLERVCRVSDILSLSADALDEIDLPDKASNRVWGALQGANELLTTVMQELDTDTMLKAEAQS